MSKGSSQPVQTQNTFRIGILGGMGPMAGVLLQKLIIEATPADQDQDHPQVVCFTNPKIPDRTTSLARDGGESFVKAIRESVQLLEHAGASVIVIPCNTAHARFETIQSGMTTPFLNLIDVGVAELVRTAPRGSTVGVLATYGTIRSSLYQSRLEARGFRYRLPDAAAQQTLMRCIYQTKARMDSRLANMVVRVAERLRERGAETIILGCTELSLFFDALIAEGYRVIDPLRAAAAELARLSQDH